MTTTSIQLGSLVILLATLGFATTITQQHVAIAKGLDDLPGDGPIIPFHMVKDKSGNWVDVTSNTNTVTTSDKAKLDSAAVANSKNDVKCFAFCFGTSTANAGSAADSRVKSPTATANPVIIKDKTINNKPAPNFHIVKESHNKDLLARSNNLDSNGNNVDIKALAAATANTGINSQGTECVDNTGSVNDEGYSQGYVDGNRDSVSLNGHGFDDSIHHGNAEFKQGYHDGYADGFNDGVFGKNKNPC